MWLSFQDPAGIFELVEVVGNGTYGQVYKVSALITWCFSDACLSHARGHAAMAAASMYDMVTVN